jgi:hypothetical protein
LVQSIFYYKIGKRRSSKNFYKNCCKQIESLESK